MRLILSALLLALLSALPVRAEVAMSGLFVAATACPATPAIRDNPDRGVTLKPQQSYRLVAGNKAPPTHYLVVVPGASPDHLWVAIGCGMMQGGDTAAPQPASPAKPAAPPSPQASTKAPKHFVLSLSWEPGFCAGNGGKPECAAESDSSFEATHFSLHGLWPDPSEYCGVPAALQRADKGSDWSNLPAVALDAKTRARLDRAMPGTQSELERHEWLRHGSCAGADANAYFGRALDFVDAVNASPVQQLFAGNIGRELQLDDIRNAFDQAFGAAAGQRIRLSCEGGGNSRRITEITIGLYGDVIGNATLPQLVAAAYPTKGGCDRGLVTAVR